MYANRAGTLGGRIGALAVLATALTLTGCDRPEDQETGSISGEEVRQTRESLDPQVAAAVDSGNSAYRAGDYQAALEQYREAIAMDDDLAAAWFGLYMAHTALGDIEAADSAMDRARSLAPGATLIHPESPDTIP